MLADWPGLAGNRLYEARDLMPTIDLRSVAKAILTDHLGLPPRVVEVQVFPDSLQAAPTKGLLRA